MSKGRAQTVVCAFCGKHAPIDKACKMRRSSFSYFDERAGIMHRGADMFEFICPTCARHRQIKDYRDKFRTGRKAKKRY